MTRYTNSDAIQDKMIPCETDPRSGELSRTLDPFHGQAVMTVGQVKGGRRHVCRECAEKHHKHLVWRMGIYWD